MLCESFFSFPKDASFCIVEYMTNAMLKKFILLKQQKPLSNEMKWLRQSWAVYWQSHILKESQYMINHSCMSEEFQYLEYEL